jgi:hypothetical protein
MSVPSSPLSSYILADPHAISIADIAPTTIADAVSSNRTISTSLRQQLMKAHNEVQPSSAASTISLQQSNDNTTNSVSNTNDINNNDTMADNDNDDNDNDNDDDGGDDDDDNDDDDTATPLSSSLHHSHPNVTRSGIPSSTPIAHQHVDTSPFQHANVSSSTPPSHGHAHGPGHYNGSGNGNVRKRRNKVELDRAERIQWLSLRGKAPRHNVRHLLIICICYYYHIGLL